MYIYILPTSNNLIKSPKDTMTQKGLLEDSPAGVTLAEITQLARACAAQRFLTKLRGCRVCSWESKGPTWRIIPVSKLLVTPFYKPFRPFGRGTTPVRGLTNHGS